jgi:hypothetical protein
METELSGLSLAQLIEALHHVEFQINRMPDWEIARSDRSERLVNLWCEIIDLITENEVIDSRGLA